MGEEGITDKTIAEWLKERWASEPGRKVPEVLPDVELPEPPDEHRPPRLWGSGGAGGAGGAGGVVEETVAGYIGMLLTCFAVAVVRAYLFVVPVYLLGAYIYASWESRKTASK